MPGLAGLTQSINRAHRLMHDTGFLNISREISTDAWERNIREARRELGEVADELARRDGSRLYTQLDGDLRQKLWRALLRSAVNAAGSGDARFDFATGRRVMRSLRGIAATNALNDLTMATNHLLSRPTGFPVRLLHRASRAYRESAPTEGAEVERRARLAGDPMPIRPLPSETDEYMRIVLDAIRRVRVIERSWEAQNPGITTFVAVAASVFGVPSGDPTGRSLADQVRDGATSGARDALTEASHTGGLLANFRTVVTAADAGISTHGRLTDPNERMRQCIEAAALEASDGEQSRAKTLIRRMRTTEIKMNDWLRWLERHRDHPAYVPPDGTMTRSPEPTRAAS